MKPKQPTKYVNVFYKKNEVIENIPSEGYVIFFFFFWTLPLVILIELMGRIFRQSHWITEEEYYKEKLKELK